MSSSQPWTATLRLVLDRFRTAGQPVWIDQVVAQVLVEHPDCELCEVALANLVRDAVIKERHSIDGGPLNSMQTPSPGSFAP